MIRNYLRVAFRNLKKNKAFAFINGIGLTVGLTCCMLITLYLLHETSYDTQHVHGDRLYQVGTVFTLNGADQRTGNTPSPMANVLQQVYPQIEGTARIMRLFSEDKTLFQYQAPGGERKAWYEQKGFTADSGFFKLFTYQFTEGNAYTAITGPYDIVISEDIARKIFGNQPALHKVIHIGSNTNGDHDYLVTGVFKPAATPSHIDARFFLSMYGGSYGDFVRNTTNLANNNMFYTYLLLKPGANAKQLESQLPRFVEEYEGKDLQAAGFSKKHFLTQVKDIHLHANMPDDVTPCGSTMYLYILASIALFTLLIACINFMNLATARSTKRSAEVGIRKTLGAARSSLVAQFLGEAVLMAFMSYVLALLFTYMLLPLFEKVSGQHIVLTNGRMIALCAGFLVLAVITGVLAGSYPAFYLSSFKPVKVLKGKLANSFAAVTLRRGLVVFQFVISIILIIASAVIFKQMRYLRQADLGFDKDQQVILSLRSDESRRMFPALKEALEKNSHILSVGGSAFYPGINNVTDQNFYAEGKSIRDGKEIKLNFIDFDYLKTLGIRSIAGRIYSAQFPADSTDGIVLNEKAISLLGYTTGNAVGKRVYTEFQGSKTTLQIVGVVKDFHYEDLHVPIGPYGFRLNDRFDDFSYAVVHINSQDVQHTIASIQQTWRRLNNNDPFEFNFLDEQFQKNYEAENRLSAIVGYFTGVAILISCLGLFGLSAFSAEQRTKEIGIRKVLGASEKSIVALLSIDFLKLVALAVVIGSPIAWWLMNRWLQDFTYKTSIGWIIFIYTTLATMLIAFFTISLQAVRAAIANPVKSLRAE
ncbi:ABC transporter permease [Deminuibacter soli]|uniref:ABC transporter permease n=1 Tax=Deminuibacter soli TaxID=2291815 RepID=A0A3E1NCG9_9BACT|nr:ABC transporter permease [Deminuibacter soli]RFM25709.1 ABC transporter permease [Deminuibacter soli]